MDIPSVPGGQTGKGSFVFNVEDSFTFDDAVLTIGLAGNQQAIVPLTATAGTAVTQRAGRGQPRRARAPPTRSSSSCWAASTAPTSRGTTAR